MKYLFGGRVLIANSVCHETGKHYKVAVWMPTTTCFFRMRIRKNRPHHRPRIFTHH